MRSLASVVLLFLALAVSTTANAWSSPGHEVVGALAAKLLSPKAAAALNGDGSLQNPGLLRGYSLAVAATWADCAKSVVKSAGTYTYRHGRYTPGACSAFETPAEEARMADFAQRNWGNCVYVKGKPCHEIWHFADIAIQRDGYDTRDVGASTEHDVVAAINACVEYLRTGRSTGIFHFGDRSEALFLLAHFVGDLHQPLHVGAVYLAQDGNLVDPDGMHPFDPATATQGGNAIAYGGHGSELHAAWDEIPRSVDVTGSDDMLSAARNVPATPGPASDWAAAWASDTVLQAHAAFADLSFSPGPGGKGWVADSSADPQYAKHRGNLQIIQLERGGKHLADLLNDIFN